MNTFIDPSLVARLQAIKLAYECGALASVPYIEPQRDDSFSHFTQIIEVKKEDSKDGDGQGGGGGGGTLRGLRQTTRRPATRSR